MSHTVKIAGSDIQFKVLAGESILDAATRHSIDLPYSCYSGVCSTCKAKCIDGDYDYDGMEIYGLDVEHNPENELLLCCAHPRSDMTIQHPDFDCSTHNQTTHLSHVFDIVSTEQNGHITQVLLKPQGQFCFNFLPGQYCIIEFDGPEFPFSIVNTPNSKYQLELHILDAPYNPAPQKLLQHILAHQPLTIKGPFGNAYLRQGDNAPIVFIAGGSGIASIKPMIETLINHSSTREIQLYWGVRDAAYLYLDPVFKGWAAQNKHFEYHPVISEQTDNWQGTTGLVHKAVLADFADLSTHQVYLSGPFEMVFSARDDFVSQRNAKREQLFSDAFEFEKTVDEWE